MRHAFNSEGDHAAATRRIRMSENVHALDPAQPSERLFGEVPLMSPDGVHPDLIEKAQRRGKADGAGDVRRSALMPPGRFPIAHFVVRDPDHCPTCRNVGRGTVAQVTRRVKKGTAEGCVGLVAGSS